MARSTLTALDRLEPQPANWVRMVRKWSALWPIQVHAIETLMAETYRDEDCLVSAPTAGGKTMAVLLPLISLCLRRDRQQPGRPGYRILYVSPMRALINQQARADGDIVSLARHAGYGCTPWMSDIDSHRKAKAWANPEGILVTTPESIEGRLLRDPSGVSLNFASLRFIVIDELHAYFNNERGRHLRSVLARLDARLERAVPRVALSATLGNTSNAETRTRDLARLGGFLRADAKRPPRVVTEAVTQSPAAGDFVAEQYFDLRLNVVTDNFSRAEVGDRTLTAGQRQIASLINGLFEQFGEKVHGKAQPLTALVFANSRHDVEVYTSHLNAIGKPITLSREWKEAFKSNDGAAPAPTARASSDDPTESLATSAQRAQNRWRYWPHHGSLPAAVRKHAEDRMSSGMIGCVLVSTTTLELGIDVGTIENVAQIGAGPSVASLRQRLGRSRRYVQQPRDRQSAAAGIQPRLDMFVREAGGELSDLGLLARLRLQTFQSLAQITLLRRRAYESPRPDALDLSTLTQQMLCTIYEYRAEGITLRVLRRILAERGPFAQSLKTRLYDKSSPTLFDAVLAHLQRADKGPALVMSDPAPDDDADTAGLYLTPRGVRRVERPDIYAAFPSPVEYTVRAPTGNVGSIDARTLSIGDVITLQGQGWEVRHVNPITRIVVVRSAAAGKAPRFPGDAIPVSGAVVREMSRLYRLDLKALLKEAKVTLLNDTALEMLKQGHRTFADAALSTRSVIDADGDVIVFPWRGQRHLRGIVAMLRACLLRAVATGPAIVIPNKTRAEVATAVRERWPRYRTMAPVELARGSVQSPRGKFDDLLTPLFWRHDFVSDGMSTQDLDRIAAELGS